MVYTIGKVVNERQESAIAEILLWYTPALWASENPTGSAIAEILLWYTPNVSKGGEFQSFTRDFD